MAELKIKADSGGGTVSLKGPATTTSNAAVQLTLPVDDGAANQYLKTDGSGALSWATVSSDVVGDTSPQLGGDLDVNGNQIKGDDVQIHAADNQVIAKFHKTNSSEFHFNGSKKLEVNNTGIGVTGSITPTGGLYLGGSGGGNYLNDYETGTWTPAVRFSSSGTTGITYNSSGNGGVYTKIGRQVICRGEINLTSKGSSTGYFAITGFPYNEGNYGGNLALGGSSQGWYYHLANWEKWFTLDMFSNDDVAIWRGGNTGNSNNDRNNSDVNDNSNISFVVHYFTDE